ncbi:hypothetical protein [Dyella psychrodurans]|uniref:Uncharacterized protein n=1 Tax=Dyella psychrodurans TaxID=1927960 RepID=A0A370XC38_9GAMM|nr:hypothetical protein [Dyella psychrodurans]RDS85837.1 hypothetical protein DWU99_00755 [Dyella psychrodurans]
MNPIVARLWSRLAPYSYAGATGDYGPAIAALKRAGALPADHPDAVDGAALEHAWFERFRPRRPLHAAPQALIDHASRVMDEPRAVLPSRPEPLDVDDLAVADAESASAAPGLFARPLAPAPASAIPRLMVRPLTRLTTAVYEDLYPTSRADFEGG